LEFFLMCFSVIKRFYTLNRDIIEILTYRYTLIFKKKWCVLAFLKYVLKIFSNFFRFCNRSVALPLHYRYRYIGKYLQQRWCNGNATLLLQKRKNSSKIDRSFLLRYMKYSSVTSVTKLVEQISRAKFTF